MRGSEDPGYPGPRFIRVGSVGVLYLKEDLDAWLDRWARLEEVASAHLRAPLAVAEGGVAHGQ
jgi:hypothetical protein